MKKYYGIFNSWDALDDDIRQETREMLAECNDIEEDEVTDNWITEAIMEGIYDERLNLNVETGGVIICLAVLGLWHGKTHAAKIVGTKVKDILYSKNDENEWYADAWDVRCNSTHHDGTNHYLYRLAANREEADDICYNWVYGDPSKRDSLLKRRTRSIRPFVAGVYGWQQFGVHRRAEIQLRKRGA